MAKGRCRDCGAVVHSNPWERWTMDSCPCGNGIDDEGVYCRIVGNIDTKEFREFNIQEQLEFEGNSIYKPRFSWEDDDV